MEIQLKPEMLVSEIGQQFKLFKVTGLKGMEMPSHISTEEAVVVVLRGEGILKLAGRGIYLKTNDSVIIPAKEPHSLEITEDFQSIVIMETDSEIKFVNK